MEVDLSKLEPTSLWRHFAALTQIPRCSGNEESAVDYVVSVSKRHGYDFARDDAGNLIIRKPATPGHEQAPTVVLQSHLDMVCEKDDAATHDFAHDPLTLTTDGTWITAIGTTLGADNGIGAAAALATLESEALIHGPLEALFTIDEERGLAGIKQLDPALIRGRRLINLDGDEEGVLFVGCAGGGNSYITLPVTRREADGQSMQVALSGLRGGHSGIEINKGGGNAIRLLAQLLYQAHLSQPLALISLAAGDKTNAIPRAATALIAAPPGTAGRVASALRQQFAPIRARYQLTEPEMNLDIEETTETEAPLSGHSQSRLFGLLLGYPVGVIAMHPELAGLVETSNNLARIRISTEEAQIVLSSRSSNMAQLAAVRAEIRALSDAVGATVSQPEGYPSWQPDLSGQFLALSQECYERRFGETPAIRAVHAGVEPAVIGRKIPEMEMISIGPTIRNAHSPSETVEIRSVTRFWFLLETMLQALAEGHPNVHTESADT